MIRGRKAPQELVDKYRAMESDRKILSEKEFYEKYPNQKESDERMKELEKRLLEENRLRELKKSKSKKSKVDVTVSHLKKLGCIIKLRDLDDLSHARLY
jgi:hypothetical protein